eukprot:1232912-Pyramimonas_sp.AAC.1
MADSSTSLAEKIGAQWFAMAECIAPGSEVVCEPEFVTILMPDRIRRLEKGFHSSPRRPSCLALRRQRSPSWVFDSA